MEITPINLILFACNQYTLGLFKHIYPELFFSVDNRLKLAILRRNSIAIASQ